MSVKKLHSGKELEEANRLWMVIEEIDQSFAYHLAQDLYLTLVTKRIGNRRQQRMVMSSAFVATLLSFRKIADFFHVGKNTRPDDIKAAQFGFRCQPPLDKAQMEELSKSIAHFTAKGMPLRQRGFAFGVLGTAIYNRCLEFFDFLEDSRLNRNVLADRQMLARLKSIRRYILANGLLPKAK